MVVKKTKNKLEREHELGSRRAVIEDLFYDFNSSRIKVYRMNFFRGMFFGVGTVIGGTIVVAIVVWILNLFTGIPGGIGEFVRYVVETVQQSSQK